MEFATILVTAFTTDRFASAIKFVDSSIAANFASSIGAIINYANFIVAFAVVVYSSIVVVVAIVTHWVQ